MGYGSPGGFDEGAGPLPSSVNTASILLFVSGGLTLLGGLLLFAVASLGAVYTLLAVVYVTLGGFEIYLGLQLRQLQPWARSAAIMVSAAGIGISVLLVSRGGASTVIGLILPAVVIFLLYRPDTLAAFPRSSKPLGL
jgi:hypothetical protein